MKVSPSKLIALRKERGWSQSRLATISGLGERTIQRIEKEGACSLESAMALASVYELSPKDFQIKESPASSTSTTHHQKFNWGGLIGMIVFAVCAYLVIALTRKYSTWEWISASLVLSLTFVFSFVAHGMRDTISCLGSTWWLLRIPAETNNISHKIAIIKSLRDYAYIIGIVSSLVCGLTILTHSKIDPAHLGDYFAYIIRPLVYSILVAELWFRPLKHRLEYILTLSFRSLKEEGKS